MRRRLFITLFGGAAAAWPLAARAQVHAKVPRILGLAPEFSGVEAVHAKMVRATAKITRETIEHAGRDYPRAMRTSLEGPIQTSALKGVLGTACERRGREGWVDVECFAQSHKPKNF